jgi:hypothetical protein
MEICKSSPPSFHVFIGCTCRCVKYMWWGVASTYTHYQQRSIWTGLNLWYVVRTPWRSVHHVQFRQLANEIRKQVKIIMVHHCHYLSKEFFKTSVVCLWNLIYIQTVTVHRLDNWACISGSVSEFSLSSFSTQIRGSSWFLCRECGGSFRQQSDQSM